MDKADRQVLARGKHLTFVARGHWEYVERTQSIVVCIVAVTDDDKLVLVEQFRPPVNKRVIEIPAGLVGDLPGQENEPTVAAARRELIEETGYDAGEMTLLATGPPSAGLSSEVVALYRASALRKVRPGGGDESEEIQVHEVPLGTTRDWLNERETRGAIIDLKIYAGLHFVDR